MQGWEMGKGGPEEGGDGGPHPTVCEEVGGVGLERGESDGGGGQHGEI